MTLRRALVVLAALAACLAAPAAAPAHHWQPGACGLPNARPLYVEFGEVSVSRTIRKEIFGAARPPLVVATSQAPLAEEFRSYGAHTIFWQMRLDQLVGATATPAEPAAVDEAVDRLVARAARETACATPLIGLNELSGAWKPTPWPAPYAGYRANVLQALRRMHARGAHPFLLAPTSPAPFTRSPEAAAWWRQVADVADVVLEVHFNGKLTASQGPVVASRARRVRMRQVLAQFTAAGVPADRLGLLHGFQSGAGAGGREGLPLANWLRVVKWEALAAQEVIAERAAAGTPLASDWSWGWGDFPTLSRIDPEKPLTACVYLWSRSPGLCDAPAMAAEWGVPFDADRLEGQIALAPGVQCVASAPRGSFSAAAVDALAAVRTASGQPLGRGSALAALFARLVDIAHVRVTLATVARAEQSIVRTRFGGDASAYAAALTARSVAPAVARGVIGDQLRRRALGRALGKKQRYPGWAVSVRRAALRTTTCARDELPSAAGADLLRTLPFLRLPA